MVTKGVFKVIYWTGSLKRRKGPFEGIAIGAGTGDVDVIIDAKGKPLKSPPLDWRSLEYEGLIFFKLKEGA